MGVRFRGGKVEVAHDLFKFTTDDENAFGSHGERILRAVGLSRFRKPTLPANYAVGVATKTAFS